MTAQSLPNVADEPEVIQPYHVMLDIETMGTGTHAAVWAIGAVKFRPGERGTEKNFYVPIDLKTSQDAGGKIDASTVLWWMDPKNDAARQSLLSADNVSLYAALQGFAQWLAMDEIVGVWGNGATFDNMIMRSAFDSVGMECPWSFRADRCFRTFKAMFPVIAPPDVGIAHNALHDAQHQVQWFHAITEMLKKGDIKIV